MRKQIISFLIAGALTCLLVGCGEQPESSGAVSESDASSVTSSVTETPTESIHEHTYTDSVTKEATCTESGEKTFTCECGDSYTEQIEKKEHNYEEVENSSVPATCTKEGKEADTKCSLCGDVISGTAISKIAHTYGDYVYNNDATTENDGTETATCSVCGDTSTRTAENTKLEHSRDTSFILTATTDSGASVECVIEYDSSAVAIELVNIGDMNWVVNGNEIPSGEVAYMHPVDETKWGPYCYPVIKSGCSSYENYKKSWIDKYIALGDANANIVEYEEYTDNGYTYYFFEGFFMTPTLIGDPDIVYVQISDNEYIELYNITFEDTLEDFVKNSFYIKEVTIK